jgi:hypothetical protein
VIIVFMATRPEIGRVVALYGHHGGRCGVVYCRLGVGVVGVACEPTPRCRTLGALSSPSPATRGAKSNELGTTEGSLQRPCELRTPSGSGLWRLKGGGGLACGELRSVDRFAQAAGLRPAQAASTVGLGLG